MKERPFCLKKSVSRFTFLVRPHRLMHKNKFSLNFLRNRFTYRAKYIIIILKNYIENKGNEMEKRKISVQIAGNPITIVTDEPDEFVKLLTDTVTSRIEETTKNSFRISTLDAALLLTLDFLGDKLKAESKIRTLESQISLYELNLKNARDELEKAKNAALSISETTENSENVSETIAGAIADVTAETSSNDGDTKIRALEKYLSSKSNGTSGGKTREEKIRYIESLLRGNDEK